MFKGFEPVYNKNSKVLILGSFPSVKSREVGFYYGNKQNRFWKMLAEVFGEQIADDIESKKTFLKKHNIALWDVVQESDLKGSMDNTLKKSNCQLGSFDKIFSETQIEKVLCNGKTAYALFLNCYSTSLPVLCLPSTSPANPRYNFDAWQKELKFLK